MKIVIVSSAKLFLLISLFYSKGYCSVMEENDFWNVINNAYEKNIENTKDSSYLLESFQDLTKVKLISSALVIENSIEYLNHDNVYALASILSGKPLSDDGFLYFRSWLITLGKETVHLARKNPVDLVQNAVLKDRLIQTDIEHEDFHYYIIDLYEMKYGDSFYDDLEDAESKLKTETTSGYDSKITLNNMKEIKERYAELFLEIIEK